MINPSKINSDHQLHTCYN